MGNSLIIPMSSGDVPSCNNNSGQQTVVTMDVQHQGSPDAAADADAIAIELGAIGDEGTKEEKAELLSGLSSPKLSFKRKVEGYIITANASGDSGNANGVLVANFDDNWYKTEKIPEDGEIISKLLDAKFAYHIQHEPPEPNDGLKTITEYCAKINLGGTFVQHMARGLIENKVKEIPAMIIIAETGAMVGLITCASSIILWKKHKTASEMLAKIGCSATVASAMGMMASMFFSTNLIWIPILGITVAFPCILYA